MSREHCAAQHPDREAACTVIVEEHKPQFAVEEDVVEEADF